MSYFRSRMTDGGTYKLQYALAPLIRLFCRLRILRFFDRNVGLWCSCFSVAIGEITSHENLYIVLAPLIRLFCRLRILGFFDRTVGLCCSCFLVAMGGRGS